MRVVPLLMQRKEETKSTQTFNEYTKLMEFVLSLFMFSSKIKLFIWKILLEQSYATTHTMFMQINLEMVHSVRKLLVWQKTQAMLDLSRKI